MTFRLFIDRARVFAHNGFFRGEGNYIECEITWNGETLQIRRSGLDPGYDQERFDASYACFEDLAEVISAS